jgi:hypothetical protein
MDCVDGKLAFRTVTVLGVTPTTGGVAAQSIQE